MGYHLAGFEVVGVDIKPQPRYPFEFIQADAMAFPLDGFDVIHASPPCQRYSRLFTTMEHKRPEQLDLIEAIRNRLQEHQYVIENVPGAPLLSGSTMLCGAMFRLRTYRHRWFESNRLFLAPYHPKHVIPCDGRSQRKEHFLNGGFISVVGHVGSYCGKEAMGIDWMLGRELSQAIPPTYTEYIGKQLIKQLQAAQDVTRQHSPSRTG